jgi:hypothetical protein
MARVRANTKRLGEDEPWVIPLPEEGTAPLLEFLRAELELVGLLEYQYGLARQIAELDEILRDPLKNEPQQVPLSDEFRRYRPIWLQVMTAKSVDYYLVYVAKILALVFAARPETLRSKAEVTIEYVLQHRSMDELVRALADDEVNRLAYKGMRELAAEVKRRTGLALFSNSVDLEKAVEIIELRNLIAHNNGVVNSTIARKIPAYASRIGQLADLGGAAFEAVYFFGRAAIQFDKLASEKFGLQILSSRENPPS